MTCAQQGTGLHILGFLMVSHPTFVDSGDPMGSCFQPRLYTDSFFKVRVLFSGNNNILLFRSQLKFLPVVSDAHWF